MSGSILRNKMVKSTLLSTYKYDSDVPGQTTKAKATLGKLVIAMRETGMANEIQLANELTVLANPYLTRVEGVQFLNLIIRGKLKMNDYMGDNV